MLLSIALFCACGGGGGDSHKTTSSETYQFQSLWPVLAQPYYFSQPSGVAVDTSGNVYVLDTSENRIKKFAANGTLLTEWGASGSDNG